MGRYATPLIFLALFCVAAALMFLPGSMSGDGKLSETAFEKSALGLRGLEVLLQEKGIEVSRAEARRREDVLEDKLLVLPLRGESPGMDGGDDAETPAERALSYVAASGIPTLVILPKWRDAVTEKGVARPQFLAPRSQLVRDLALLDRSDLVVLRSPATFIEEEVPLSFGGKQKATLFAAQVFDRPTLPATCKELFGVSAGALLLACEGEVTFYLLSDPDMLNNHGLALGDNAATSLSIARLLIADSLTGSVLIDPSALSMSAPTDEDQTRASTQSLEDFQRLVTYPFTVIWGVVLIVTLLFFWRGAWRFGPAYRGEGQTAARSKRAVVEAEARLLRLGGNDGQMTAQFVRAQLLDKAAQVFGPTARLSADIERFFAHLASRDKALASALRAVSTTLIEQGAAMKGPELHKHLDLFQTLMGRAELGS